MECIFNKPVSKKSSNLRKFLHKVPKVFTKLITKSGKNTQKFPLDKNEAVSSDMPKTLPKRFSLKARKFEGNYVFTEPNQFHQKAPLDKQNAVFETMPKFVSKDLLFCWKHEKKETKFSWKCNKSSRRVEKSFHKLSQLLFNSPLFCSKSENNEKNSFLSLKTCFSLNYFSSHTEWYGDNAASENSRNSLKRFFKLRNSLFKKENFLIQAFLGKSSSGHVE